MTLGFQCRGGGEGRLFFSPTGTLVVGKGGRRCRWGRPGTLIQHFCSSGERGEKVERNQCAKRTITCLGNILLYMPIWTRATMECKEVCIPGRGQTQRIWTQTNQSNKKRFKYVELTNWPRFDIIDSTEPRSFITETPDLRKSLNTVYISPVCVHSVRVCALVLCFYVRVFLCVPVCVCTCGCVYLWEYLKRRHTQFSAPFWFGWVQSDMYCREEYRRCSESVSTFHLLWIDFRILFIPFISTFLKRNSCISYFSGHRILFWALWFLKDVLKKRESELVCVLGDDNSHRQQFTVNGAVNKCLLMDTMGFSSRPERGRS